MQFDRMGMQVPWSQRRSFAFHIGGTGTLCLFLFLELREVIDKFIVVISLLETCSFPHSRPLSKTENPQVAAPFLLSSMATSIAPPL